MLELKLILGITDHNIYVVNAITVLIGNNVGYITEYSQMN